MTEKTWLDACSHLPWGTSASVASHPWMRLWADSHFLVSCRQTSF